MAIRNEKLEEGLKELASMIATDYIRRSRGEVTSPLTPHGDCTAPIPESEIIARTEPDTSGSGVVYTETVRVENFIRNKKQMLKNHKESQGGKNVANQRNIRGCNAAPSGEDKAGDQERRP